MGNGAKAARTRERNAANAAKSEPKSQVKSNLAALVFMCQICRQQFLSTTRAPAMEEHARNKHEKTIAECFPNYTK